MLDTENVAVAVAVGDDGQEGNDDAAVVGGWGGWS